MRGVAHTSPRYRGRNRALIRLNKDLRILKRQAFTILFTGLSGAGKATLARMTQHFLAQRGLAAEILDGAYLKRFLYELADHQLPNNFTNAKRLAYIAKLLNRHGVCVLIATIMPFEKSREILRRTPPHYLEVYVCCRMPTLVVSEIPKGIIAKRSREKLII